MRSGLVLLAALLGCGDDHAGPSDARVVDAPCTDEDGDGNCAATDCFDTPAVPSTSEITLANLVLAPTMESVGVRVSLQTARTDVTVTTRICVRDSGVPWAGTRTFPVGTMGVQIGSFLWLTADSEYDVEVAATASGTGERATLYGTVRTRKDTPPTAAGVVYVSPSGSDSNSGSVTAPFLTIAKAQLALGPTTRVIELMPGVYREEVVLGVAGAPDAYYVLRGQPGAIIDGAHAPIQAGVTWTFDGATSTYSFGPLDLAAILPVRHIEMDDTRLYAYTTFTALATQSQSGVSGGFYYDDAGKVLHVRMPDGSSPAAHTIHVPTANVGVHVDRVGYWIVQDLEVRHFNDIGIMARGGPGVWLRRNTLSHTNTGILGTQPYGGATLMPVDLVVEDNTVRDTSIWGWPYLACKSKLCETTGILVACAARHVIRRNHIEGTFNGIGPTASGDEPAPGDIPVCGTDGDTYDNTITHVADDGIELDGSGINQRIFRNRIEFRHTNSISLSPLTYGPVWIMRNVSIGWAEAFIKLRTDNDKGWKVIAHNTAIADTTALGYALWPPQCYDGLFAFNNVLEGVGYTVVHGKNTTCVPSDAAFFMHVELDGNVHWQRTATPLVQWMGTTYPTLQAFTLATGNETHGVQQAPLFEADGATPAAASVMLDRAIALPGINDRVIDGSPDIGAIER